MQKRYYMKDEGGFFRDPVTVDEQPNRKPRIIAFIVVLLLLLVALGFAANYFLHTKVKKEVTGSALPAITQMPTQAPTDTPGATPSATPSPAPLVIQVLNGSGVPGAAGKVAATLESSGYTISGTGNAGTFDYTNIVIEVKAGEQAVLTKLKSDLSKDYTIGSTSATLTDKTKVDAVVIVGK